MGGGKEENSVCRAARLQLVNKRWPLFSECHFLGLQQGRPRLPAGSWGLWLTSLGKTPKSSSCEVARNELSLSCGQRCVLCRSSGTAGEQAGFCGRPGEAEAGHSLGKREGVASLPPGTCTYGHQGRCWSRPPWESGWDSGLIEYQSLKLANLLVTMHSTKCELCRGSPVFSCRR